MAAYQGKVALMEKKKTKRVRRSEFWNYDESLFVSFMCESSSFIPMEINGEWHYVVPFSKQAGQLLRRANRKDFDLYMKP